MSKGMTKADAVLRDDRLLKLIDESLASEVQDAKEAGALGFMARALVQATLPHKKPQGNIFERRNGAFSLTMMAPPRAGLPYGVIPRLLLAWLSTEAVQTRSCELVLGDSLSGFMRELGMVPTGGRWGSITRLREQCRRLFTTTISCLYEGEDHLFEGERGFRLADSHILWWEPKQPNQAELFASKVVLSQAFYQEIVTHPVPIDLRVLKELSRSPMALDVYVWLTYRMSYLRRQTTIPWAGLQAQFGAEYRRTRDFKAAFTDHLKSVLVEYRAAKVEASDSGLVLRPSPPHVPRICG